MTTHSVRTLFRFDDGDGDDPRHVITLSWDHAGASHGQPVPVLEDGNAIDAFSLMFHVPAEPAADAAAIAEFRDFGYRFGQ